MVIHKNGSMFQDETHDCYVNTINTVGAMGAGIALEFKRRYPDMFEHYKELCSRHIIAPGDCWRWEEGEKTLAMLAVKYDWRNRIRFSWAKMAIRNFVNDLKTDRILAKNIALPRIGSQNGGRGELFAHASDNWPVDSESGYMKLEPFLLKELEAFPDKTFTIYNLSLDPKEKEDKVEI